MKLPKFTKEKKEKKTQSVYVSLQEFHERNHQKVDLSALVTHYLYLGNKLSKEDLEYIENKKILFPEVMNITEENFVAYDGLYEDLFKIFTERKMHAQFIYSILQREDKSIFSEKTYEEACLFLIKKGEYDNFYKGSMSANFFRKLAVYCTFQQKITLIFRQMDWSALEIFVNENKVEIKKEIKTLVDFTMPDIRRTELIKFLYCEHRDLFEEFCKICDRLEESVERIFIIARVLPDEYFVKNWIPLNNLEALALAYSQAEAEKFLTADMELLWKKFEENKDNRTVFFTLAPHFSQNFWSKFVEFLLVKKPEKDFLITISEQQKSLSRLIKAGYPIENLI